MGGFRTPAHAITLDLGRPASESLHHADPYELGRRIPQADIHPDSWRSQPSEVSTPLELDGF
jgi:hypothetical protein